jgi:cell wall-associated NlpC family hydrolase
MELYRSARHIRLGMLRPGDILFFKLNGKRVSHVGIYLGEKRFIHAPKTGRDVSIGSLNNGYWRRHLVTAGRLM